MHAVQMDGLRLRDELIDSLDQLYDRAERAFPDRIVGHQRKEVFNLAGHADVSRSVDVNMLREHSSVKDGTGHLRGACNYARRRGKDNE
ncbi:hypothetical protein [Burkholderia ambifaria]|uniref:hypothetical protein n=1 Tax=Burkholderia ambifaria TaxID=152480 RepID=UPI001591D2C6|nr:hypothetical protein [Burkholderia ambifaria]